MSNAPTKSSKRARSVSPRPSGSAQHSRKQQRLPGERETLYDLYRDIIIVVVGPDAHHFYIYEGLACRDAEFFKTALNSSFREAMDKKILLPDDDVQVFKVYQTWLNTGSLRYIFDHEKEEWWLHLAKLWIFTDKIRSPRLRNRVTDAFFDIVARNGSNVDKNFAYAQAGTVDYVYSNTYRGSPLRMIFVELYLYLSPSNTSMRRYHPEFLATTLKEAMTNKGPPRNKLPRSALYHMDCEDSCCKKLCS